MSPNIRSFVRSFGPPTAAVVSRRAPSAPVVVSRVGRPALVAAVRLGCARSQRHSCRARLRLHARGGRSAARPVSILCGHPNQRRDDVRTHHLGMRGALTIWAAHCVCRMVRTHPPAWRVRGARRLDARALDHWTHAPLASLLLFATAGLRTTRTCAPCAALVSAESVARRARLRSAARGSRTR